MSDFDTLDCAMFDVVIKRLHSEDSVLTFVWRGRRDILCVHVWNFDKLSAPIISNLRSN